MVECTGQCLIWPKYMGHSCRIYTHASLLTMCHTHCQHLIPVTQQIEVSSPLISLHPLTSRPETPRRTDPRCRFLWSPQSFTALVMDISKTIPAVQGTSGAAKFPPFEMPEVLHDTLSQESKGSWDFPQIPKSQEKICSSMGISSDWKNNTP